MEVDAASGFAGDGGANDVAEAHDESAFLVCFADGCEGVSGFAGLGDGDDEVAAAEDGVAVAEFGGLLDFRVDVGEVFEGVFADESGVEGGAATEEDDAGDFRQVAR